MNKEQTRLVKIIRKKALIKGKEIILSSGQKSSFYIDLRKISLDAEGLSLVSELFFEHIKKNKITSVGGPTIGADPIVGGILHLAFKKKYKLGGFLIRKKQKGHGTKSLIEGNMPTKKDKIFVLDDVATTGGSILYSIDVLKTHKLKPLLCGCIVDRLSGARENVAKKGSRLFSLLTSEDII